ncbi:MAG: OmpA family protein [Elusimicrobiota bacterium]|nr:OmpA family protein [Elusimicrobiota bacterium]
MNNKKLLIVFVLVFSVGFLVSGCKKQEEESQEQQAPQQEAQSSVEVSNQEQANPPETSAPKSQESVQIKEANVAQKPVKRTVVSLERAHFDTDKYLLTQEARIILSKNSKTLLKNKRASIIIEGYCDETGSQKYNYNLGLKRANNVKSYYASLGVSAKNIKVVSYGKKRPLDKSGSESAKNRRAETKIVR